MRKLLLLALAACLAFAGCSSDDGKDDNAIRYDEAKGYLTNLASAKHGIIGRWSAGTAHIEYKSDGMSCDGTFGQDVLPHCTHTYELFQRDNKIYLKYKEISTGTYSIEAEVTTLTKSQFKYTSTSGTSSFIRVEKN